MAQKKSGKRTGFALADANTRKAVATAGGRASQAAGHGVLFDSETGRAANAAIVHRHRFTPEERRRAQRASVAARRANAELRREMERDDDGG